MTVVCRVETRRSALSCAATTARIDAYVSMEFSRPVLKPMGFRECSKSAEFLREALITIKKPQGNSCEVLQNSQAQSTMVSKADAEIARQSETQTNVSRLRSGIISGSRQEMTSDVVVFYLLKCADSSPQ